MIHFDLFDYGRALVGGVFIGISASVLLIFSGRIAGISGILYRSIKGPAEGGWRWLFLAGMAISGLLSALFFPGFSHLENADSPLLLIIAGGLVGFGSVLGNGCTSGHGVCGISRLSPRSLVATVTFMASGALVVFLIRNFLLGGV